MICLKLIGASHSNLLQVARDEVEVDDRNLAHALRIDLTVRRKHRASDVTVDALKGASDESGVQVDDDVEVAQRRPKDLLLRNKT